MPFQRTNSELNVKGTSRPRPGSASDGRSKRGNYAQDTRRIDHRGGSFMMADAATRKVDFTQDTVGQPPKGFEFGHTAGAGKPGKWVVESDGSNKLLAQTDADSRARDFPSRCWPTSPRPMSISPSASNRSPGASIRRQVWCGGIATKTTTTSSARMRSKTTSCSTRWRMAGARICPSRARAARTGRRRRSPVASGARCVSSPQAPLSRSTSTAAKLYEVEDATFAQAGNVGVWTKADSVTQFDDLTVVTVENERAGRRTFRLATCSRSRFADAVACGPGARTRASNARSRSTCRPTACSASRCCGNTQRRSGVKVNPVYDTEETKSTGLANRLLAEKARPQADVFWSNEPVRTLVLKSRDVLAPYRSPSAEGSRRRSSIPDGYWTGFSARMRVIAYNTKLVKAAEAPQSVFDLADPKWRGQVAIADPRFGSTSFHVAALYAIAGDEKMDDFFRRLKANGVRVVDGNSVVRDLVARGEVKVGLTDTDDVNVAIEDGQPIGMVLPDKDGLGVPVMPNMVSLIANAPHPEEGRRLIDYLLSADVERQLAQSDAVQIPLARGRAGTEEHPCDRHLQADDARLREGRRSRGGRHGPTRGDPGPVRTASRLSERDARRMWRLAVEPGPHRLRHRRALLRDRPCLPTRRHARLVARR